MKIIAVVEVLGTIGWGLITNFISNQVEDPVIAQLTEGKRLQNHDLARALHLAFLQAQERIADELMKHGALSHGEMVRLKQRVNVLAEERRSLGQVEHVAPPFDQAEAIALLVTPTRPEVAEAQQELSDRLFALAAPGGSELPGKYLDRLQGQLFEWMGRYFMMQVKYEPVVFHALTTETNALILQNQVEMKRLLQQMYQRLVPPEPSTCKSVPVELKSVHFVDRPEVADAIAAGFGRQNPVLLCGLGGAGKTQVAGWYARTNWGRYRYILWLHAEEEAILASEYAALAARLQLPAAGLVDQADVISAVHGWFEQATDWLLIFDNATGPEAIARYLTGNPRGSYPDHLAQPGVGGCGRTGGDRPLQTGGVGGLPAGSHG